MRLGLLKSNCLLHTAGNRLLLKQVQFDTVSLSFDPLSERATNMHMCFRVMTASVLAEGLAEAHDAYGVCIGYVPVSRWNINELILIQCSILLVVRPNKCNVFDQFYLNTFQGMNAIWGADTIDLTAYPLCLRARWSAEN